MADILVGTCSWTDATLIRSGGFYPAWAKSAEARLQFYASQFPLVEVDSSYYSLPAEAALPPETISLSKLVPSATLTWKVVR